MIEVLDVHDAMKKIAYDKVQAEAKAKQKGNKPWLPHDASVE